MKSINFSKLPIEIQDHVKSILKAYDDVTVWYEHGRFTFGDSIKAKYGEDHRFIGHYYAHEIFSEDERIVNYCNEFHSYPSEYKGFRDWSLIRDYDATFKMENGIIVKA